MNLLATYRQRFAGVVRKFELRGNHLTVRGRKLGSSFDLNHDLATVNAQFDRALVRAPLFYGGLVLLGIALIGLIVLTFTDGLMTPALVVVAVIAVVGVVAVAFRFRPLRVFIFKNKNADYAFEIIGAGPDATQVEEFVTLVAEQIRKANHGN